jgi:lipopolysaccharide export system protein LptC
VRSAGNVLFPLIVVALLAALTFWLQRAVNPDDPTRRALKRHDPDFVIENFTVRRFDENGNLKQSLLAKTLTHYPDNETTTVTNPDLTYYPGGESTQLSSQTAFLSNDNKKVDLSGDVRLIKPATAVRPLTTLRTENLTVFPDEDIAEGSSRVTITRGQSVVSGDTVHYNGRENIAVLGGRVKGIFYRDKKS